MEPPASLLSITFGASRAPAVIRLAATVTAIRLQPQDGRPIGLLTQPRRVEVDAINGFRTAVDLPVGSGGQRQP